MKVLHASLAAVVAATVMLSIFIAPASAHFVHPTGILIAVFPQEPLVFLNAPQTIDRSFLIAVKPPWYFVPGLMSFESVSLTIQFTGDCDRCNPDPVNPPVLVGADRTGTLVANLGAADMTEENNGMVFTIPFSVIIPAGAILGNYMFFLTAEADAADGTVFMGWTQIAFAIWS